VKKARVGTITVAALVLACAEMAMAMMSNPELIEAFAFAG
jgi:hypothetical protein